MGFRYVKGFGAREREQLERARAPMRTAPSSGAAASTWPDLDTFVRAAQLSERALVALAEAGGFDALGVTRRQAIWQARGLAKYADTSLALAPPPREVAFAPLAAAEEVSWDYRASHHSARGHPMSRYRDALRGRGVPDARTVAMLGHGHRLDYVGMVITRQRPGTATGVTFLTLEDETGFVNVVVWRQVFEKYELIGKTASPLGVRGKLQVERGVIHLVAERLYVPDLSTDAPADRDGEDRAAQPTSRNFH
jgi:error-prone DNA polymerase